jgi:hypothetical protein
MLCRAASSTSFRSTFIADPPKERKKARLSWYHPDDTMVPRDWWSQGLLADIKYYSEPRWGALAAGRLVLVAAVGCAGSCCGGKLRRAGGEGMLVWC